MNKITYTNKEQYEFLSRCNADLIIEIHEEMMLPEDMEFDEFLVKYNEKHLAKYGYKLQIKFE